MEYSIRTLKDEMMELENEIYILKTNDPKVSARRITRLEHQVRDLKHGIEVLNEFLDIFRP